MCNYCNPENLKPLYEDKNFYIDIWKKTINVAIQDAKENFKSPVSIKINYCPMCGERIFLYQDEEK